MFMGSNIYISAVMRETALKFALKKYRVVSRTIATSKMELFVALSGF